MNNHKKILLFTDWYEPGFKGGGPIQSVKNLVDLLRDKYSFYIFCSDRDLGDEGPYKNITVDQWTATEPHVRIWYASPSFLSRKNIQHFIQEVNPDRVYFNSMYSVKFTLIPLWILLRKNFSGKIVLAPRGMLHKGALDKKTLKKKAFLSLFRYTRSYRNITFHATDSQEEKDILYFFSNHAKVIVARDTPSLQRQEYKRIKKEAGHLDCLFVSRIHPKKNLLYFLDLLNKIDQTVTIQFDIYGSCDDQSYCTACQLAAGKLPRHIRVNFLGPLVNKGVLDTIRSYQLFVLPTMGENFGHAIFESLSVGRPVLISDQTPWRGLSEKKAGWDLALDHPDLFKRALEEAIQFDQDRFDDWSFHAWKFANDYITQANPEEEYLKLFN